MTMDGTDVIRTPSIAEWLDGVALRDLAIHNDTAACVDSRGDVYQWGNGFTGGDDRKKKPILTLREKVLFKCLPLCGHVLITFSEYQKTQAY